MTMDEMPISTHGELKLYETSPGRYSIRDDYMNRTLARNLGPEKAMRVWGKITSGQVDVETMGVRRGPAGAREGSEWLTTHRLGRYRQHITQKERLLAEIEGLARGGFKGRSMIDELRGKQEEV